MDEAERAAYEKAHGYAPPGYRATGSVDWFSARHPERGNCACGVETDRWVVVNLRGGLTAGTPGPDQKAHEAVKRGVVADYVALCQGCEDRNSIASLERTLTRDGISERTRQQAVAQLQTLRGAKAA